MTPPVPDYFLSDVHLRLDRPDRGARLASVVDRLAASDRLTVVGDLCDFWYAARQHRADPMRCDGLRSLARFRDRGGSIVALGGNHDAWLGPFYERTFGARFVADSIDLDLGGLRVHVAHGHRVGARTSWKALLESRAFLAGFRAAPSPLADALGSLLDRPTRPTRTISTGEASMPSGRSSRPSTAGPTSRSSVTSTARSIPARAGPGWSSWGAGKPRRATWSSTTARPS